MAPQTAHDTRTGFQTAKRNDMGREAIDYSQAAVAVRADLDNLPKTAAELQRNMAEWCQDNWGEVPGDTMLKEKISPIYKHPRRSAGR